MGVAPRSGRSGWATYPWDFSPDVVDTPRSRPGAGSATRHRPVHFAKHRTMNPAITAFVDELAADPTTRGVVLFGSQARGTARPDSDADLAIIVDRPGFVMGYAERDGQEFELVHLSEATATAYFSENRDAAV